MEFKVFVGVELNKLNNYSYDLVYGTCIKHHKSIENFADVSINDEGTRKRILLWKKVLKII